MSWQQARQLTIPEWEALREQWRKTPPTPVLMAAYVGYEPKEKPREFDAAAMAELAQYMGAGA